MRITGITGRGLARAISEYFWEQGEFREEDPTEAIVESIERMGIQDSVDQSTTRRRKGIRARVGRSLLRRLGFKWREVGKGVYKDGHERPDVVEYRKEFLDYLDSLNPYLVEFDENGDIKDKEYPPGCFPGSSTQRPIVMLTHDESTFQANDGRRYVWMEDGENHLRPKGKGRGIMVSDFLLPCSRLSTAKLSPERRSELNLPLNASKLFEFGSAGEGYWEAEDVINHTCDIALPIVEAVFPGYQALLLFDNARSHASYAEDALLVRNMNLGPGGEQKRLRPGYMHGDKTQIQQMVDANGIPKGIQRVLEERGLWRQGLKLECTKPKCDDCERRAKCTSCKKGVICQQCRRKKQCIGPCTRTSKCGECKRRAKCKDCRKKECCDDCARHTGRKCKSCEKLPARCSAEG